MSCWTHRRRRCLGVSLYFLCCLLIALGTTRVRADSIFDDNWMPPEKSEPAQSTPPPVVPHDPQSVSPAAESQPATQPVRLAIPSKIARENSQEELKKLFAAQLKDQTPAGRRALATQLYTAVDNTNDNSVDQYVLLTAAIRAAKEASDLPTCIAAAHKLSQLFVVDEVALNTDAALHMNLRCATPADTTENVRATLDLLDPIIAGGDLPSAVRLCELVKPLAPSDPSLSPLVAKRNKEMSVLRAIYDRFAPAISTLERTPDDGEANLAVGRYYCILLDAWDKGNPYLVQGNDAEFKKAAAIDLASAQTADDEKRAGDTWWAVAAKQAEPVRARVRARAAFFYNKALQSATGLSRELMTQRLAEMDTDAANPQQTQVATASGGRTAKERVTGATMVDRVRPNTVWTGDSRQLKFLQRSGTQFRALFHHYTGGVSTVTGTIVNGKLTFVDGNVSWIATINDSELDFTCYRGKAVWTTFVLRLEP